MNVPQPETVVYKTVGDCRIHADVYRPSMEGRLPVVVWLHGGALITGHRGGIQPYQRDAYLAAGYGVVALDYRLAPEVKLPAILEDLRDGFQWVRGIGSTRWALDPERVAVVGHSAGGYLALMTATCIDPPPRAIVSFYGYGDIVGPWYSQPDPFYCRQPLVPEREAREAVGDAVLSCTEGQHERHRFYLYCRQQGRWPVEVVGLDPVKQADAFREYCPVVRTGPRHPPTLLLHGDADTDVPCEQSILMAEALAEAGVEHELRVLAGAGHGFDGIREDAADGRAFEHVLGFLARHLA